MSERQMYRGDTFVFDVQVVKNNVPQDITGWTMWFTAKYSYPDQDSQAAVQQSTGDGIAYTFPLAGKAEITVAPIKTRGFPDGPVTLVYDVQVKDLLGSIFTVDAGTLLVIPDVTRRIA